MFRVFGLCSVCGLVCVFELVGLFYLIVCSGLLCICLVYLCCLFNVFDLGGVFNACDVCSLWCLCNSLCAFYVFWFM